MKPLHTALVAGAIATSLALPLGPASADGGGRDRHDRGGSAVGLLSGGTALVSFRLHDPSNVRTIGAVSGLSGDTSLVGIDFRVQDGLLYGVGDAGGVYTLSTSTGRATKVSQLSVALSGTRFGVDFNPAANRLRVISDTGQNLRHDLAGATVVDGTLTYPPATTPAPGVTAAAYTNNDLDTATATTLFDVDTTLDQVAIQSPANSGSLAATGKLGVDTGSEAGFDITTNSRTGANAGWATLEVEGQQRLYRVDLLSGEATRKGSFPAKAQVADLAVPIGR